MRLKLMRYDITLEYILKSTSQKTWKNLNIENVSVYSPDRQLNMSNKQYWWVWENYGRWLRNYDTEIIYSERFAY